MTPQEPLYKETIDFDCSLEKSKGGQGGIRTPDTWIFSTAKQGRESAIFRLKWPFPKIKPKLFTDILPA